jgi:hypothetical protein
VKAGIAYSVVNTTDAKSGNSVAVITLIMMDWLQLKLHHLHGASLLFSPNNLHIRFG